MGKLLAARTGAPTLEPRVGLYDPRMGKLRRLAQNLGLVYRDDGSWRPFGVRPRPATPAARTEKPSGETEGAGGRPAT